MFQDAERETLAANGNDRDVCDPLNLRSQDLIVEGSGNRLRRKNYRRFVDKMRLVRVRCPVQGGGLAASNDARAAILRALAAQDADAAALAGWRHVDRARLRTSEAMRRTGDDAAVCAGAPDGPDARRGDRSDLSPACRGAISQNMVLTVRDLRKSYAGEGPAFEVLRGVDLDLPAGGSLALTGESGSGKSTLMHLIAGLDEPDGGRIEIDGTDLARLDDAGRARIRREAVGVVFQQFNLVPSLDAAANVAFQARLAGRHDVARTARLIERLGLGAHRRKYPEQLSGGQQQRVAIGRALAGRPRLLLADEPTGNLDEDTGRQVIDLMFELVAEAGAALMLVTHSDRLAARADRRLHLSHGRVGTAAGARAAE